MPPHMFLSKWMLLKPVTSGVFTPSRRTFSSAGLPSSMNLKVSPSTAATIVPVSWIGMSVYAAPT